MKFIKEEDKKTRDYIFQKNYKTKFGTRFILVILGIIIIAIAISGLVFF